MPVWFDRGDGAEAIKALKDLAALAPEGREEAMKLALAINQDVNGEGKLGLGQVQYYSSLGDAAVVGLMNWALERQDTPAAFRSMAAWSLPWTQTPEETLKQYGAALETERDEGVQFALVRNLGRRPQSRVRASAGRALRRRGPRRLGPRDRRDVACQER